MAKSEDPISEQRPRPGLGNCAACGRGIPFGYLPVVTKWQPRVLAETSNNKLVVMVPEVLYCRPCSDAAPANPSNRRRSHAPVYIPQEVQLSAREVLTRVWAVMSKETPLSSKALAEAAGIEDKELVLSLVRKLKAAGKAVFVDGRWARAGYSV